MNAKQRDQLNALNEQLSAVRDNIEAMAEEEQEKFDNLSAGLQASERGQAMESAATALQEAVEHLCSTINSIDEACNS